MFNVVIDLDDTLFAGAEAFLPPLNRATGKLFTKQDLRSTDLCIPYGITAQAIRDIWVREKSMESMDWLPVDSHSSSAHFWRVFLESIHQENELFGPFVQIFYCTARGWHPDGLDISFQQLSSCGAKIDKDNIFVVPPGESKAADLIRRGIDPHVFIDDSYSNIQDIKGQFPDCKCYLYTQPWNKDIPYGYRVSNIKEIEAAIRYQTVAGTTVKSASGLTSPIGEIPPRLNPPNSNETLDINFEMPACGANDFHRHFNDTVLTKDIVPNTVTPLGTLILGLSTLDMQFLSIDFKAVSCYCVQDKDVDLRTTLGSFHLDENGLRYDVRGVRTNQDRFDFFSQFDSKLYPSNAPGVFDGEIYTLMISNEISGLYLYTKNSFVKANNVFGFFKSDDLFRKVVDEFRAHIEKNLEDHQDKIFFSIPINFLP